MYTCLYRRNRFDVRLWALAFGAALVAVLSGCAGSRGGFSLDPQVTRDFQTGVIQSDYQYYYQGRDDMPYAIMAVDRSYSVPSRYWIAFDPQPEQLKNMSGNVYGKHRYDPYGSYILDPQGKVIGIWYSNVYSRSITVDPGAKTVEVLFPNPENDDGMSIQKFG